MTPLGRRRRLGRTAALCGPLRPSKPTTTPTTEIVRTPAYEAPVASEVVLDPAPEHTEVVPTWQALLDLRVWRTRPWWLRVAASLVVRRRNDLRR